MEGFEVSAIGEAGANTGSRRSCCRRPRCLGPGQVTGTPFEAISVDRSGRLHQALAAVLKDHKSLKKLKLWRCEVGDVGAQASGFCYF